ncbi:hypothetical protein AB6A40_008933 [Gnathostoma spinigerum]|uniref:Uncharacterized protein n=1 Tax=Gnathostoma spinigerum TaxID=75299 RepID=A0ABD6EVK4_9BILA
MKLELLAVPLLCSQDLITFKCIENSSEDKYLVYISELVHWMRPWYSAVTEIFFHSVTSVTDVPVCYGRRANIHGSDMSRQSKKNQSAVRGGENATTNNLWIPQLQQTKQRIKWPDSGMLARPSVTAQFTLIPLEV